MRPDLYCERWGDIETMEHLLCKCMHCYQLLWICLGDIITLYLTSNTQELIPKVELSQLNVIYNVPHPSLLLHIRNKFTNNTFVILTQEIKRDIIYCFINLPPSARQVTNLCRLRVHLDSTFHRIGSYFQYIVLGKIANVISTLQQVQKRNLDHL
jgi:hypothetical protein